MAHAMFARVKNGSQRFDCLEKTLALDTATRVNLPEETVIVARDQH
jgi:hypothetical protein